MDEELGFLERDFFDSLRWLLVGAVAWTAAKDDGIAERIGHQAVLGMHTALVQSRALYDFFYKNGSNDDNARAGHFCAPDGWVPPESHFYTTYIAHQKPANKRVFHLVYGRDRHSGGTGDEGSDHLNQQIQSMAEDLVCLTKQFREAVEPEYLDAVTSALNGALAEAENMAGSCGCTNPFAGQAAP